MLNKKINIKLTFVFFMLISVFLTLFLCITNSTIKAAEYEYRTVGSTVKVTYKSGNGTGSDVTVDQPVLKSGTKGSNDYTDYKIIFARNNKTVNVGTTSTPLNVTINFTHQNDANGYSYILTGWKLTQVVKNKNGNTTTYTEFVEPLNRNYTNPSDPAKDIDRVYAQEGWYIVPNYVTEIIVEAVYGRAIYIRSPFDKMYYNEYHSFAYGENILGDGTVVRSQSAPDNLKTSIIATEKSSDSNTGKSESDAIATLRRAYQLISNDAKNTVYSNVVVLCGDLYEINRRSTGSDKLIAGAVSGTYTDYYSSALGYSTSSYSNKHMTITSIDGDKKFYLCSNANDVQVYASLRLDNVKFSKITNGVEKIDMYSDSVSVSTYSVAARFSMYGAGSMLEITETVPSTMGSQFIWARNASKIIINNGTWILYALWTSASAVNNNKLYYIIGGLSSFARLCNSIGQDVVPANDAYYTNPAVMNITGGYITELQGTPHKEKLHIKGNAYIYMSGGRVRDFYGGKEGGVVSNGSEKGDINITTYGGTIDSFYGGGQRYTSNVEGSVNINLNETKITNSIYGGGKGGTVSTNINLSINKCTIGGSVFGAGLGLTDELTYIIQWSSGPVVNGIDNAINNFNKNAASLGNPLWNEAPKGYPSYDAENAQIVTRIYHSKSEGEGNHNLFLNGKKAALTLSEVTGNVNVTIKDSTVSGNVYGGGSISVVRGNISLSTDNTTIKGNIFGGYWHSPELLGIVFRLHVHEDNQVPKATDEMMKSKFGLPHGDRNYFPIARIQNPLRL